MSETRVAIVGVVVSDTDSVESLNRILHEFSQHIIGRMGIPYGARKINLISVALDAPLEVIADLSDRIGKLPGVSSQTAYSNVVTVIEQD
ncbi:MAG: iron-only hydrogenase system regulator [Deltaproteobacteria bacterium]|jgi:putative iron-only hydrogenase system regulator|nr:iron-only hydrogenase system regulator [Deltaproteobacteria bacterium]